jgi:hypothetical protein
MRTLPVRGREKQADGRSLPESWNAYLAEGPVAPGDFMDEVADLPVQERGRRPAGGRLASHRKRDRAVR